MLEKSQKSEKLIFFKSQTECSRDINAFAGAARKESMDFMKWRALQSAHKWDSLKSMKLMGGEQEINKYWLYSNVAAD